ncbi:MAG: hypothetical protein ACYCZX_07010 [Rhodospirillaceae bacterium]
MKTAAELRGYASTCHALARQAVTEDERRQLLEMANTWLLLASGQTLLPPSGQDPPRTGEQQAAAAPFCGQVHRSSLA